MIKPCRDAAKVREFFSRPEIYRYAVSAEGSPYIDMENLSYRKFYLSYELDKETVGMISVDVETNAMCKFHPYILRKQKLHYDDMVKKFFAWFFENMPDDAVKLNAVIPEHKKGPILAAQRAGMTLEGCDRMSHREGGEMYGRLLYGITKDEVLNG